MAWRRRACSTEIRRIASAAAAKKWRWPSNLCSATKRRNGSCTSDFASSIWPGFSRAGRAAASLRSGRPCLMALCTASRAIRYRWVAVRLSATATGLGQSIVQLTCPTGTRDPTDTAHTNHDPAYEFSKRE